MCLCRDQAWSLGWLSLCSSLSSPLTPSTSFCLQRILLYLCTLILPLTESKYEDTLGYLHAPKVKIECCVISPSVLPSAHTRLLRASTLLPPSSALCFLPPTFYNPFPLTAPTDAVLRPSIHLIRPSWPICPSSPLQHLCNRPVTRSFQQSNQQPASFTRMSFAIVQPFSPAQSSTFLPCLLALKDFAPFVRFRSLYARSR
ncbi:uncharacterized protein EI90DRAFT_3030523 [Cantharellus anzutake]|uniref:uncharacterized protein n=1 Tax=Cantharellus anzutake TaxID=1750568 RepID=UPI001902EF23|nr:uncharacterized protein EI90DRAFT_3030523 [Cantharellus anzutake]KAF8342874.1 hypothetical protein EI90DRAFT_3030523 [Cantharellus anzutake]